MVVETNVTQVKTRVNAVKRERNRHPGVPLFAWERIFAPIKREIAKFPQAVRFENCEFLIRNLSLIKFITQYY